MCAFMRRQIDIKHSPAQEIQAIMSQSEARLRKAEAELIDVGY